MRDRSTDRWQWSVFMLETSGGRRGADGAPSPVLVVSRESANIALPVVTAVPLARMRAGRRIYPNETCLPPESTGLEGPAILLAHQIRTVPKSALSTRNGAVEDPALRAAVRAAVQIQLDLDARTADRSATRVNMESAL